MTTDKRKNMLADAAVKCKIKNIVGKTVDHDRDITANKPKDIYNEAKKYKEDIIQTQTRKTFFSGSIMWEDTLTHQAELTKIYDNNKIINDYFSYAIICS